MGKYKPYSVVAPPYEVTSGGIRVMYGMRSWLETKGQIVMMNAKFEDPDFITIYPEITNGHPTGSNTVVRYILQTPGLMQSYGVPSPTTEEYKTNPIYQNDSFYVFSRIYDTFGVPDDHVLFLPILNLHIFKDQGKKRTGTCYLVGKGQNQHKHPKEHSFEITREFAQDQQALADMFNRCHTFFCYDRLSASMDIARLCGCKVQYYGDFSITDLMKYETGMNGLGYTNEKVQLDTKKFRDHYEGMIETFSKRLDKFIEATQA
jgi:hypothetical protein